MAERRAREPGSDATRSAADEALSWRGSRDALAGRMRDGFGGLVARAGERAERLRETARGLTRSALLQQAEAARDRGNLEAAFWLLREEFTDHADRPEVAVAFWDVAVSLDRAEPACAAAAGLVERHAAAQEIELAVQYWNELASRVPGAFVAPAAVARMLPELVSLAQRALERPEPGEDEADTREQDCAHAIELARHALRGTLDPDNAPLTPGLALRLAEEGREVDLELARRIAAVALASSELHEAKRSRLAAWASATADGDPGQPEAEAETVGRDEPGGEATPDPGLETPVPPPLVLSDEEIAAAAARLRRRQAGDAPPLAERGDGGPDATEILEAFPLALEDEALVLRMGERRTTRVPYARIEALAAVEIARDGQSPLALIDLALNWTRREREPLRIVRLRTNTFDPKGLVPGAPDDALHALLAELLERSRAVPLPDPESALGLRLARFEHLGEYESSTLGIGPSGQPE